MRSLLLSVAGFITGFATIADICGLYASGISALPSAVILWIAALILGTVLSAPFFLAPPTSGTAWAISLPFPLWLVFLAAKAVTWVGINILRGVWELIYLARRQAHVS